jgi:hypothetical protein
MKDPELAERTEGESKGLGDASGLKCRVLSPALPSADGWGG